MSVFPDRVKRRRHFTSPANVPGSYFYPILTDVYATREIRRRRGSWDTHRYSRYVAKDLPDAPIWKQTPGRLAFGLETPDSDWEKVHSGRDV